MTSALTIAPVTSGTASQAKEVILNGLQDYFPEINHSMNQDLHNLLSTYTQPGNLFVVGMLHDKVIATGALLKESTTTARLCRMSVAKEYRRQGIAKQLILHLEKKAARFGYTQIVLETTEGWERPIQLYLSMGYNITATLNDEVHFQKYI